MKRIQDTKGVNEILPIPGAQVPLIAIEDYKGVKIDLLMASLPRVTVPGDLNILDDNVLDGCAELTVKVLRGPRDTEKIAKLVESELDAFLLTLRLIRWWAKSRGMWGNKYGYFGGVNCTIMVAFICRKAMEIRNKGGKAVKIEALSLLRLFFKWPWFTPKGRWKQPIRACITNDDREGNWIPQETDSEGRWRPTFKEIMPVITPTYPTMNSMIAVNYSSFAVIRAEIERGKNVIDEIDKNEENSDKNKPKLYEKLFEKKSFLAQPFDAFLAIQIVSEFPETYKKWKGVSSARANNIVRRMCMSYMRRYIVGVHFWPKDFSGLVTEKKANAKDVESQEKEETNSESTKGGDETELSCFFLIGFCIHRDCKNLMAKRTAREKLDHAVNVVVKRIMSWPQRDPDCKMTPHVLRFTDLPDHIFESHGGREYCAEVRNFCTFMLCICHSSIVTVHIHPFVSMHRPEKLQ